MKKFLAFALTMIVSLGSITPAFAEQGNDNGNLKSKPLIEIAQSIGVRNGTTPRKIDDTTYFIEAPLADIQATLGDSFKSDSSRSNLSTSPTPDATGTIITGYMLKRIYPFSDINFYVDQEVAVKVILEYAVYRFLECYGQTIYPLGSGTFVYSQGIPIITISEDCRYLTAQNSGMVTGTINASYSANFLAMGFSVSQTYNVSNNHVYIYYKYDGNYTGAVIH